VSAIPSHELSRYQYAAEQMCLRLGVGPHMASDQYDPYSQPMWVQYAIRMYEHNVMLETMRSCGVSIG